MTLITLKEIMLAFLAFFIVGCLIPLLFYPIDTWVAYFTHESPLMFILKNTAYFVQVEIWGFIFLFGYKVITK